MKCYACRTEIVAGTLCPHCRRDQRPYNRILAASNRAYNEGLACAKARDLTGAAEHLNLSLRYNKNNTDARNLLGLVYYESGDVVRGLNEWVVSRSLNPSGNIAGEYMEMLTKNTGTMKKYGSLAQKYNQALSLCRHGSRDLAKIQLRRAVKKYKRHGLVPAYQLLALMFIQDGEYDQAAEVLEDAAAIDAANPITSRYQHLISTHVEGASGLPKRKWLRRKKAATIDFSDGNDTVIMPRTSIFDAMDNTKSGIINILVGGIIGVLASVFLIWPTLEQNANTDAQSALVTANEKAKSTESNVENLNEEVKKLKKKLENYEGKSDIKGSYDNLVIAQRATQNKDIDAAGVALSTVNRDLLKKDGKAVYDEIEAIVAEKRMKDTYDAGAAAFRSTSYEEAINLLQGVVDAQPDYDDGNAMYYLAQCYDSTGNNEKAKEYYTQFLNVHGGTRRGRAANHYLKEILREEREAAGESQDRQ